MANSRKTVNGRRAGTAVRGRPYAKKRKNDTVGVHAQHGELIENLPIGIWKTNPDGKIILANNSVLKIMGYSSIEALRKRDLETGSYAGNQRPEFLERLAREGVIKGFETTWQKADKNTINIRVSARAVRNAKGDIIFYEGTLEDVTAQKQTEEELRAKAEFLEEVITNASVGIIVIDENNKYVLINPESGRIVGHWPDDWTGKEAGLNVHPEDQGRALSHFIQAVSGEPTEFEIRIRAANGKYVHVNIHLSPIELMGSPHVLGVVHDITKRKELEEEALNTKTRGMLEVIMIAVSVFFKKIPQGEIIGMLATFQELLEKYLKPVFDEDMEKLQLAESEPAITSDAQARILKRYLEWLSNMHDRFGMKTERASLGKTASLDKHQCKWLEAAKESPIHCKICEIILNKTFSWSGIKGTAKLENTIAGGANTCTYIFELQRQ